MKANNESNWNESCLNICTISTIVRIWQKEESLWSRSRCCSYVDDRVDLRTARSLIMFLKEFITIYQNTSLNCFSTSSLIALNKKRHKVFIYFFHSFAINVESIFSCTSFVMSNMISDLFAFSSNIFDFFLAIFEDVTTISLIHVKNFVLRHVFNAHVNSSNVEAMNFMIHIELIMIIDMMHIIRTISYDQYVATTIAMLQQTFRIDRNANDALIYTMLLLQTSLSKIMKKFIARIVVYLLYDTIVLAILHLFRTLVTLIRNMLNTRLLFLLTSIWLLRFLEKIILRLLNS